MYLRCDRCSNTQTTINKHGSANWYKAKEGKICNSCYRKEQNASIKLLVFRYYSKGSVLCACCGEHKNEFLTLDHKGGNGTKHRKRVNRKTGMAFYRWLKQNNYPSGYQVLCWNCNCSKGIFGYCPHNA